MQKIATRELTHDLISAAQKIMEIYGQLEQAINSLAKLVPSYLNT